MSSEHPLNTTVTGSCGWNKRKPRGFQAQCSINLSKSPILIWHQKTGSLHIWTGCPIAGEGGNIERPLHRRHERHLHNISTPFVVPGYTTSTAPATPLTAINCKPNHLSLCICVWPTWLYCETLWPHQNGNPRSRQTATQENFRRALQQSPCPQNILWILPRLDHVDERNVNHAGFRHSVPKK